MTAPGEQRGAGDDPQPRRTRSEAHAAGVGLAEEQGVEGLDQQAGDPQAGENHRRQDGELSPGYGAEAAKGPQHVGLHLLGDAEVEQHADQGAGQVAEHQTEDEQGHDVLQAPADQEHEAENQGGAGHRRGDHPGLSRGARARPGARPR